MPKKKTPLQEVARLRDLLLVAIRNSYTYDRDKAEIQATLCIIRIQQIIVDARDHH